MYCAAKWSSWWKPSARSCWIKAHCIIQNRKIAENLSISSLSFLALCWQKRCVLANFKQVSLPILSFTIPNDRIAHWKIWRRVKWKNSPPRMSNETSVFEPPDFLFSMPNWSGLCFCVSYLLGTASSKKRCYVKAFRVYNNPTKFASLIDLFELGGVVHFGAGGVTRTHDLLITKCIGALHLTVFRDFGAFPLGILREVRPILSIVFARSFPRVGHGVGQSTFRARTREAPPCKKSNKIGKKCCKLESYKSCLSCVRIDTFCTAVVNKSYSMEIACSDFNGNYLSFFAKFLGLQASVAVIDDLS